MQQGGRALKELWSSRAHPSPAADAACQARSGRLSAILELVAAIDWINGAEALAPFSRVCNQLLVHPDIVRCMVAKAYGLELEPGLLVSRWKHYSALTVSAA